MNSNLITLKSCFYSVLLLTFLSGCQAKEELPGANLAPVVHADGECNLGDEQSFELEEMDPALNGSDATYAFVLSNTGDDFQLQECVCAVEQYEINFDALPAEFLVKDENDNAIPYTTTGGTPTSPDRTIIIDPDLMYDSASEIHLYFQVAPVLEDAGGLCVIDNFGGIDRTSHVDLTTYHSDPVKVTYQKNYTVWIEDLMIPTAMTVPY